MTVEEIPADEIVNMTEFWHKAFKVNGCTPCCHSCGKWILPGHLFQLTTVKTRTQYRAGQTKVGIGDRHESTEIMICGTCDPKEFEIKEYEAAELYKKRKAEEGGGCFRINGKIVH